jgi:para-aminobenzoate synthetase component I
MIFSRFKWNKETILELEHPSQAYIYFRKRRLNLLTGFPESYPIEKFQSELDQIQLQDHYTKPVIFHFYYEYGLWQMGHSLPDEQPLAIMIEYQSAKKRAPRKPRLKHIPLQTLERPSWSEYKEVFQKIQEELHAGNCYQVNLTYPFDFATDDLLDPRDIADYFFAQKNLGAYAHCTYLGDEMILSNSPECLFQFRPNEIFTMPIKGTIKTKGKKISVLWKQMLNDRKEEGELLMISDLLKNDLNRLQKPQAKVLKLRAPLTVPGLLHQYSLISLKLSGPLSLGQTMRSLFPGGSITGAPKKRVMDIIQSSERFSRGIYCGSTILCWGKRKAASINIRTVNISVEERLWRYGAGGGITLLSRPVDEFKEMEAKVSSFLTLLKMEGY